jgi:CBS domain-containing protein
MRWIREGEAMLRVADVMSKDLFTIDADATLAEAAFELDTELASGAPVSERSGAIVGMISKTDLLESDKPLSMKRVRDSMTPFAYRVRPDDPLEFAAKVMAHRGVHRVLVEGPHGEAVGILTSMDIVRAFAEGADH